MRSHLGYDSHGSDQECIRAVLAGQHEAYADLVSRYQGLVYSVCCKMTGDAAAAEDVAQETFIKAFRALAAYRHEAAFSTWLYQIAVRQCLDWRRRQQRETAREQAWQQQWDRDRLVHGGLGHDASVATPERVVLAREGREEVRRRVDSLREPYRTVIQLYYFQEQSYEAIARRTGVSPKTVESQLYRARRLLREQGGIQL